jgi:hypothetical protein
MLTFFTRRVTIVAIQFVCCLDVVTQAYMTHDGLGVTLLTGLKLSECKLQKASLKPFFNVLVCSAYITTFFALYQEQSLFGLCQKVGWYIREEFYNHFFGPWM